MPVFRVEKNANYTTMSNHHLRDRTLSMKAKGLLSMLLSLPETWNYSVRGIAAISKENVDAVMNAMKELERHGYLHREQTRTANGRLGKTRYVIYEIPPAEPCSDLPCTENSDTVKTYTDTPYTEKSAQTITNKKKNENNQRRKYGTFQNVLLSEDEYAKLRNEFPMDYQERIERLSEYIASSGRRYKNHLATIRCWARKDAKPKRYDASAYHYEGEDSL